MTKVTLKSRINDPCYNGMVKKNELQGRLKELIKDQIQMQNEEQVTEVTRRYEAAQFSTGTEKNAAAEKRVAPLNTSNT